jgi:hypothetical protein
LAVVEPMPAFEAAVIARIAWLGENAPEAWLDNFLAALDTLRRDIGFFPEASPPVKQDSRVIVRQRRFPAGLPYVVFYAHMREDPVAIVYLTHLFHERQRRPRIALKDWPW